MIYGLTELGRRVAIYDKGGALLENDYLYYIDSHIYFSADCRFY